MLNFLAQIPLNAERLPTPDSWGMFRLVFTNSLLVAGVVVALVVWLARRATRQIELVPSRPDQNVFESIIEALYDMLEGIVGRHMVAKTFPLLATLFLFILASNWFGLLPGVGTIGFGEGRGPGFSLARLADPLLRPASADLNLTLGMAVVFSVFWLIWSIQEAGVGGFLFHIFGPKGAVKGFLKYPLVAIFAFVGVIDVISIAFRPVSLSLRLFGTIYAGENLMHTMSTLGTTMGMPAPIATVMSVLVPVPFYFLELLVGVVQALVFTLLGAVYIKLTTEHHDEHPAHDDHPVAAVEGINPVAHPAPAH